MYPLLISLGPQKPFLGLVCRSADWALLPFGGYKAQLNCVKGEFGLFFVLVFVSVRGTLGSWHVSSAAPTLVSVFCGGERGEVPGAWLQGGRRSWQTFCCPAASAVMQRACNMLGMAQRKQNYVIWKVPVILKAMKDLPGSFCKAVQKRYFGMAVNGRVKTIPHQHHQKDMHFMHSCILSQ